MVYTQSYGTPKSRESQFWEFQDSDLEVPWQNDIWVLAPWLGTKNTIRGKVVASPIPGHGEFCEFMFAHGLFVHQKCSSYTLTNLLFGLCRSVWIIDLLFNLPSPHPGAPACSFTLEVLRAKERAPIPPPSDVFTFVFTIESIKELRVHHMIWRVDVEVWWRKEG